MLRALYVDINAVSLNPSSTFLPQLIASSCDDVDFYGPGYRSSTELRLGLRNWVESTGPYNFIIVGAHVPFFFDDIEQAISGLKWHAKNNLAGHFQLDTIGHFAKDFFEAVPFLDIPHKIVSTIGFDYYGARQSAVDRIIDWNFSVLGPNHQFIKSVDDLPAFKSEEKHYQRKKGLVSDRWLNFLRENPNRVITASHFVLPSELCFSPLSNRQPLVAVPGVAYYTRKSVKNILKENKIKVASSYTSVVLRALNRLGLHVFSTQTGLRLYNESFKDVLFKSRYIYTAPGVFGFAVRKFFEIPAAGGLLLCEPCSGFKDIGFEPNIHYLDANKESIVDLVQSFDKRSDLQKVATSAQAVVLKKHTLNARAGQISQCFAAIVSGKFKEAKWVNGHYQVGS